MGNSFSLSKFQRLSSCYKAEEPYATLMLVKNNIKEMLINGAALISVHETLLASNLEIDVETLDVFIRGTIMPDLINNGDWLGQNLYRRDPTKKINNDNVLYMPIHLVKSNLTTRCVRAVEVEKALKDAGLLTYEKRSSRTGTFTLPLYKDTPGICSLWCPISTKGIVPNELYDFKDLGKLKLNREVYFLLLRYLATGIDSKSTFISKMEALACPTK